MSLPQPSRLIACARCASVKVRCDRKVPCSQCTAKGRECKPRHTSRKIRAPLSPETGSNTLGLALDAGVAYQQALPDAGHNNTAIEQFPMDDANAWFSNASGVQGQQNRNISEASSELADMFDFSHPNFGQWPPFHSGNNINMDEFFGQDAINGDLCFDLDQVMGNNPQATSGSQSPHHWNAFHNQQNSPATASTSSGTGSSSTGLQASASRMPDPARFHPGRQASTTLSSRQVSRPNPVEPQPSDGGTDRLPNVRCNPEFGETRAGCALQNMAKLLAHQDVWRDFESRHTSYTAEEPLPSGARDVLVAAVQLLLYRAMQNRTATSSPGTREELGSSILGPFVRLPPSHVLVHFVKQYATRVEPYLNLAGSSQIRINDILQVNMADVGSLLVTLLIAQGAMLSDAEDHKSLIMADGLTEACKLAVSDVLRTSSMTDPMAGGSALQLITLCAWSGAEALAPFAMERRAQYLSMLEPTGLLYHDPPDQSPSSNIHDQWAVWKRQQHRSRLAYAWVYVDLELSLFYDVSPMLSINDLHVPLSQESAMLHLESAEAWQQRIHSNGSGIASETPSLNHLFRGFIQGRLTRNSGVAPHHLRLLLHPLQAMVFEQQQLLRVFGKDEPSNSHRVLSKLKVLGRLQETQDLLQQLSLLLSSTKRDSEQSRDSAQAVGRVSMIILHLCGLNTLTCIPEIEAIARRHPPPVAQRSEVWRRVQYSGSEHSVLFHSGQIFRHLEKLHHNARPPWWPIAAYRAAMACWIFNQPQVSQSGGEGPEVAINKLAGSDELMDRYLHDHSGTPVFKSPDGSRLAVLQGNNALHYCAAVVGTHPTRLGRGIESKLKFLAHRWATV